jgi:hypothetical protein
VTDPSIPIVIEMAEVASMSYFLIPASKPKLTNPDDVQESIRGLKIRKAPDPKPIQYKALKHLPSEQYPSSPRFSTRFSAHMNFPKCGRTHLSFLPLN